MTAVVFGITLTLSCALSAQSPPPGWIEIDGAKTPDQIPEHIVWSTGFETIAALRGKVDMDEGPFGRLGLSVRDFQLVFDEAARYKERRAECQESGLRMVAAMKGQEAEKVEKAIRAHTLDCRTEMLDSKDRFLLRMSPEGSASLTRWMLEERRNIKSVMPKSELEFYRLPR